MKQPQMSVSEYLMLLKSAKVTASKSYALANQDVRKGQVYFRSQERMDILRQLLTASDTGTIPAQEFFLQKKISSRIKKSLDSIDFDSLKTRIKNLVGPDGQGWYRGQCPNCALKETGEGGHTTNSFVFNDNDGRILCHKGCYIGDIASALGGN